MLLASSERDDAADRIVGGNTHRHAITGHDLDSKPAHSPAQLGEHLMPLIALHAVETTAVDRHDRALHVNQIVLTQ